MTTQLDPEDLEGLSELGFGPGEVLVCPCYDHTPRFQEGERLEQLFEQRCDWMRDHGLAHHLAVDGQAGSLTYAELDARASQLARYLLAEGARPGDRIGLVFDHAPYAYLAMLAVLKMNAAYVPLDASFPPDRVSYIVEDAGVAMVLSLSHLAPQLGELGARLVCLDEVASAVSAQDPGRLGPAERGDAADELCYIIYTSGSTGRPKGVAIDHPSICNFVRVAVEVYGIEPDDRVYQGLTIAFDFSVEEIWVPLVAGATLVPKPAATTLLGDELGAYLAHHRISALCCVPTLLATLEEDLPELRFLLVSGEACPEDLVARWHRPGRRFLNVYGPTEATVTATWAEVHPERPVTIGAPLPTYSVVILDPEAPVALPPGEMGEIGIAGIGLARGYLNRDDLTQRAFISDFVGIDHNPSERIYRTGDLGRINDQGEIEYHGRIDTQVKIRGYRIELTEIESVIMQVPGIAQAVVDTYEPTPGAVELVAYYSLRKDTASVDTEAVYEHLRQRLPTYMIPAYFEALAVIPMLASDKADRKSLPAPTGPRRRAGSADHVAPADAAEATLAEVLGSVLGGDAVSVTAHFFDDLGANSLLMAQFCARVREHPELPSVAMKDVYLNPTVRALSGAMAEMAPASVGAQSVPSEPMPTPVRASTAQYLTCGALQLLVFLGYTYLNALVLVVGYRWISASTGLLHGWERSVAVSAATFFGLCALPILAKWTLIGRWKRQEIRIWSLAYFRFWLVKTLIRANPMALFIGSPLYVLYLKALGAKIGRGVAIFSRNIPVCTDLLAIGDGTVIRKDSFFNCYRAQAGVIQTGSVTLGKDVFIGEKTVLDIETSMGDGSQLGHTSSLHPFQAVPDHQHWHGSPAQPTEADYRAVEPAQCSTLRRASYGAMQLVTRLALYVPLGIGVVAVLLTKVPLLARLLEPGPVAFTKLAFYRDGLAFSFVLFFAPLAAGFVVVLTLPRVLNAALKTERVYPLYGFHYALQRTIARVTNLKFFMDLLGDSSYIVFYLRRLGYDLGKVIQTGSNFGTELQHESPFLSTIGTGTMVSDALSIMNAEFSATSFRLSRVSVGEHNFLGNNIAFPSNARVGDNCLLATKAMIPIDGKIRDGVGLLGSPCFEIPRSVQRDASFDDLKNPDELTRRLAAKNRYNVGTIFLFLFVRWIHFYGVTVIGMSAANLYQRVSVLAVAGAGVLTFFYSIAYSVLIERAVAGFRPLTPKFCSIYEPYFWWHERLWKLLAMPRLNGTPFKSILWRLLGVRIGRRVFDDGCAIPEKSLVAIGDHCTINAGSVIQCHSLEDGTFKSDQTTIGADCTLGVESFVHYGVTMGDGATLGADAFLMKGEEIPSGARWRGNPAREIESLAAASCGQ